MTGPVSLKRVANPAADYLPALGMVHNARIKAIMENDNFSGPSGSPAGALSNEAAGGFKAIDDAAQKAAEKAAKAYERIKRGALEFIQSQELEASVMPVHAPGIPADTKTVWLDGGTYTAAPWGVDGYQVQFTLNVVDL